MKLSLVVDGNVEGLRADCSLDLQAGYIYNKSSVFSDRDRNSISWCEI